MAERRFREIVEVGSGTLVVGDPGYLLPRRTSRTDGVDCEEVIRGDAAGVPVPLADRPVLLMPGFGCAETFPVFGEFHEGGLARVTIEFVGPEDEDS